jgi:heme/copper-type cytochrome/quinol oxidase subunit 4
MLRLVSIIGIALAMVIGFVALSTQMRDDFYMRTKVTEIFGLGNK